LPMPQRRPAADHQVAEGEPARGVEGGEPAAGDAGAIAVAGDAAADREPVDAGHRVARIEEQGPVRRAAGLRKPQPDLVVDAREQVVDEQQVLVLGVELLPLAGVRRAAQPDDVAGAARVFAAVVLADPAHVPALDPGAVFGPHREQASLGVRANAGPRVLPHIYVKDGATDDAERSGAGGG